MSHLGNTDPHPVPNDDHRWWSVREIAEDLCISLNTIYKWSSRGEPWFPRSIRLANGEKRVRRDWYEDWLAGMEAACER